MFRNLISSILLQQNKYQEEINKRKLPHVFASKPFNANVAKREYNTIKRAIEDREKFKKRQEEKEWSEAKRKALIKKRTDIRRAEKAAKAKEDAEKKAKLDAAVKAKLARDKKDAAKDAATEEAESEARDEGEPVLLGLPEHPQLGEGSEQQESSDDEVMPSGTSKRRSGPAPETAEPSKRTRSKRPYLPDNSVESRFGVILTEMKEMKVSIEGIRKDNEATTRVSPYLVSIFESQVSLAINLKFQHSIYFVVSLSENERQHEGPRQGYREHRERHERAEPSADQEGF